MKLIVLKKSNCMPCSMVERFLQGKLDGINHEILSVEEPEGMEVAGMYGVMQVPVLIALDDNGVIIEKVGGYNPEAIDGILSRFGVDNG